MSLSKRPSEQSIAAAEQHNEKERRRQAGALILVVFLLGFALRAGVGLWTQREGLRGDETWRIMTQNLLVGKGLVMDREGYITLNGWQSHRPPLFPLVMAGFMRMTGQSRTLTILLLAGISALTILVTYRLASGLFGPKVAIVSASLVAVYPFFVFHDPTFIESGLYCMLTAMLALCLTEVVRKPSLSMACSVGVLCALSALVRGTALPLAVLLCAWFLLIPGRRMRSRVLFLVCFLIGFSVCVGPWIVRNYSLHRRPLFVTGGGRSLWMAQNDLVDKMYPYHSIDAVEWKLWGRLSESEQAEVRGLPEARTDAWFRKRAIEFVASRPLEPVILGFKKASAAYSPLMNPRDRHERVKYVVHAFSYGILLVPGLIGVVLSASRWRSLSGIYLLYLVFTIVSCVYWAHSRHRAFLDVYLIIFAVYGIQRLWHGRESMQ